MPMEKKLPVRTPSYSCGLDNGLGHALAFLNSPPQICHESPAPDPTDYLHKYPVRTVVTGHRLQATPWVSWAA